MSYNYKSLCCVCKKGLTEKDCVPCCVCHTILNKTAKFIKLKNYQAAKKLFEVYVIQISFNTRKDIELLLQELLSRLDYDLQLYQNFTDYSCNYNN